MANLMSALILFVTVVISVGLGIFAAYLIITGIVYALAPSPEPCPPSVLAPNQTGSGA